LLHSLTSEMFPKHPQTMFFLKTTQPKVLLPGPGGGLLVANEPSDTAAL